MVHATSRRTNKVVIKNVTRGPIQNAILAEDNLLEDIWEKIKPALVFSIKYFRMLLGEQDLQLRRSPLCMDKHFKTKCSYLQTQLGVLISTRNLALSMPENKHQDLVKIILTTWNSSRKKLTLHEVASFLGLASNMSLTKEWENALVLHSSVPHVSH